VCAALVIMLAGCATAAPQAAGTMQPAAAAATSDLLLPVRHDAATGRIMLTVPRLDEDMLYLNTLATGLGTTAASLDRGQVGFDAVVRFERHGARVLLVQPNTTHRAVGGDDALQQSVAQSFPRSVMASFAVHSESPAGTVVDATDFFLSDVYDVIGRLRSARLGSLRVDRDRSYIDGASTSAFPLNTEVRSVLTYVTDDPAPDLRRVAPDGRSITMEQHHSFVRLPERPLVSRAFDPRAGIFTTSFFDFAQGFDADYRRRSIVRWRLEPSDTAAYLRGELVEPVRPIVYYMDPAIPEPYRTAFMEGGLWWNEIFEAAGWRNAFRIEALPEGADAMDARYPMIYWVHRQQRGPSVGPSLRDPRTGEIITTVVRMDSYRSLVDHDIYMGLLPASGGRALQLDAQEFSMARRRQHTAHEIGHTLGLAHNFIAATQGRSSVMDYPYPLIDLDAEGNIDVSRAYRPGGGAHDTLAIRYAYTWYPTPQAEAEGLRKIVQEAAARGLRFVTDMHAGAAGSVPGATQWVEGEDMLSALERTMAVRRVLLDSFDQRAAQPGEPLAVLNRRFAHVYLHHRYAISGATKYVGGMEFGYTMAGETEPTRIIPADQQRRALRAVLAALQPHALRVPDRVSSLIPPVPFGYDADLTLIPSPAGTAFDPVSLAHSLAQELVDALLHPQRAARLVVFHARAAGDPVSSAQPTTPTTPTNPTNPTNPANAAHLTNPANPTNPTSPANPTNPANAAHLTNPANAAHPARGEVLTLNEVLTSLLDATWGPAFAAWSRSTADPMDAALRRVTQRAVVDAMLDLAGSRAATPEVRAVCEQHLDVLRKRLAGTHATVTEDQGHHAAARRDIERYFDGRDDPAARPRPEPIRLPWP
jgi:hypothetical protein